MHKHRHTQTHTHTHTHTHTYIYIYIYIYIYGVIVIVLENGPYDTSSNPGRDCISHSANTLGKCMNPIILPPAMWK